jgi:hypothetical protein
MTTSIEDIAIVSSIDREKVAAVIKALRLPTETLQKTAWPESFLEEFDAPPGTGECLGIYHRLLHAVLAQGVGR